MATPADLTGKVLWLRAKDLPGSAGSAVTTWPDQSGGHNDAKAAGTTPTLATSSTPNGGKSVAFGGSGYFTLLDTIFAGGADARGWAPSEDPFRAFDGNTGTQWTDTGAGSGSWLSVRAKAQAVLTAYSIRVRSGWNDRSPKSWIMQGSNDNQTWVDLDSRSGQAFADGGTNNYTVSGAAAYQFYRLWITQVNASSIVNVTELTLTGPSLVQTAAEAWFVVKSGEASGNFRGLSSLGNSEVTSPSMYPSTDGTVQEAAFIRTVAGGDRRIFTPSVPITQWRLYRVSNDGSAYEIRLDEQLQSSTPGLAFDHTHYPRLGANLNASQGFFGNVAEVLIRDRVATSAEVADLITYVNTEHGLTVPGGSAPSPLAAEGAVPAASTVSGEAGAIRRAEGTVVAASGVTGEPTATTPHVNHPAEGTVAAVTAVAGELGVARTNPAEGRIDAVAAVTGEPLIGHNAEGVGAAVSGVRGEPIVTAPSILAITALAGSETIIGATLKARIVGTPLTALAGSTADIDRVLNVTPVTVEMVAGAGSMVRITMPRDWGEDPRTGRPGYRLKIVTRDGTGVVELDKAVIMPETEAVNTPDTFSFRVARADAKARRVLAVAHQAQLWRGKVMLTKGDIGPGRADGAWITFDVKDPSALLFGKRVIGRIPKRQLLHNADFTKGLAYWTGAYGPDSALKSPPTARVVDDDYALSGKAIELGAVDKVVTTKVDVQTSAVFVPNKATYLSGGEQKIKDVGANIPEGAVVRITGFTANDGTGDGLNLSLRRAQAAKATLAAMGKKFVFKMPSPLRSPNQNDGTVVGRGYYEQISGGLAPNRRVTIAYEGTQTATGHQQYERQFLTVTQPVDAKVPLTITLAGDMRIIRWDGAPKNGYAMRLILHPLNNLAEDKIVDEETRAMDEATPRVRWAHYEASVEVPADGKTYTLEVQFQPPAGLARWANLGLWPHDQLGFFDVDQALIVKALVEHAQDAAMGKGSLGIGTRTPLTGVPRTKEYPFHERMPVGTALEWFTSIAHGVDIDCEVTPTSATIVTHFPRQGTSADIALVHGGSASIVKAYRPLTTANRDLASSVIMQADGSGASRPEAYARDDKALGGTLLEAVVSAESETSPGELQEGADVALSQSISPRPGWEVVIDPAHTTRVLDEIGKGDLVRLVLPDEGVDRALRMVSRTLDPATDIPTLTLVEA